MKLGFLTACLRQWSLADIAAWSAENGYEALEVAAWPALGDRPFSATHIDVSDFARTSNEDPVWGGTEGRIQAGLRVAHRALRPLIVS